MRSLSKQLVFAYRTMVYDIAQFSRVLVAMFGKYTDWEKNTWYVYCACTSQIIVIIMLAKQNSATQSEREKEKKHINNNNGTAVQQRGKILNTTKRRMTQHTTTQ